MNPKSTLKAFYVVLILLFVFHDFFAQVNTSKGALILTAGSDITLGFGENELSYNGKNLEDFDSKKFSLNPSLGAFLVYNLAMGIAIPIEFEQLKYREYTEQKLLYGFAFFMRYYMADHDVRPYFNLEAGILSMNSKLEGNVSSKDDYNEELTGPALDVGLGVTIFLSDKVGLDTQLSYGFSKMSYNGDSSLKLITKGVGMLIGVTVIL